MTEINTLEDAEQALAAEAEPQQEPQQEPDPEEVRARPRGWKPREEYDGDDWVDAAEFNRRAPLFESLKKQSRHIKELEKKMDLVAKHASMVAEKTREKTIAEFEAKKRQAVIDGDEAAYDRAHKAAEDARKEELPKVEPELPSAVQEFAERNDWFEKDEDMTEFMLAKTRNLVKQGLSLDEAIPKAEAKTKELFAPKTPPNPKKNKPATVMPGSREQRKTLSMSDLTPEQREVWQALKGSMTQEQFLKDLEAL